jgi:hypothetical protein
MYRRRARPSDRLTSRTIRGQRRAAQARDRGSLGRSRTRISHTILKRIVGSTLRRNSIDFRQTGHVRSSAIVKYGCATNKAALDELG